MEFPDLAAFFSRTCDTWRFTAYLKRRRVQGAGRVFEVSVIVLLIAVLLAVISALQPLALKLHVPSTVLLAGVGVAIGVAATALLHTEVTDAFNRVVDPIVNLPVRSSTFLYVFLPLLLFQAALTIQVRQMLEDAAPILLMAIVAVVVATGVIGLTLSGLFALPLVACLLLGAIVATTDPSAVVAIFRDIGAPARLTRLVEGESLLNDAAAIALFTLLLGLLVAGDSLDLAESGANFALGFLGGIALGLVGGRALVGALPWLRGHKAAETTLTLAVPYLLFILGDVYLGVSGVVAVVVAGLVVSAAGRSRISPENWAYLQNVWEQIAFWAGSLVFILASLLVPKLLVDLSFRDVLIILTVVIAALAARALVLFGMIPLLCAVRLSKPVSHRFKVVILWGGLRGAVTLALALAVTENQALDDDVKRFVALGATGFVLFGLFVNGTSLRKIITRLGLDKLSSVDQGVRNQILALALSGVRDSVQEAGQRYEVSPVVMREAARFYEFRSTQVSSTPIEETVSERERLAVGLVALANRERELVLDLHAHQTLPNSVVEHLTRATERMVEEARSEGRLGYMRAARALLDYGPLFRLSYACHRFIRLERFLVLQLRERFEVLLTLRLVLGELHGFVHKRLKPLLGERMADLIAEMVQSRRAATAKELDALRLQYPEYAEALERRFLNQFAVRQERLHYSLLRSEGLLNEEIYASLMAETRTSASRAEALPRLDLGLDVAALVRQLDLFGDLTDKQMKRLSRLLRPVFVVPGQYVVRKGEKGDAIYFISSGAVEVVLDKNKVRLGRGDFFGEMAVLGNRRRSADVVAITYGQLLVLDQSDFEKFLAAYPAIRERIDQVVEKRVKMNIGFQPNL